VRLCPELPGIWLQQEFLRRVCVREQMYVPADDDDQHITERAGVCAAISPPPFLCTHTTRRHCIGSVGGKITLFNKMAGNKIVGFIQARMNLLCRRPARYVYTLLVQKTLQLFANLEAYMVGREREPGSVVRVSSQIFRIYTSTRRAESFVPTCIYLWANGCVCAERESMHAPKLFAVLASGPKSVRKIGQTS